MVRFVRPRLTGRVPLVTAAAGGGAVALAALLLPAAMLEGVVEASGLAAVLPVAAPPLGLTARALLAMGGGGAVALVVWAASYLLVGPGGPLAPRVRTPGPVVRRADAHPDAPPRRPMGAADLPTPPPMPSPPVEKPVPADLDQPLAAFDPAAVPSVPREPVRALKPLASPLAPGERLETYILTPPPPPPTPPPPAASEPPSIDALLRRLEQGALRRAASAG
jgi:hypothetical protein